MPTHNSTEILIMDIYYHHKQRQCRQHLSGALLIHLVNLWLNLCGTHLRT